MGAAEPRPKRLASLFVLRGLVCMLVWEWIAVEAVVVGESGGELIRRGSIGGSWYVGVMKVSGSGSWSSEIWGARCVCVLV